MRRKYTHTKKNNVLHRALLTGLMAAATFTAIAQNTAVLEEHWWQPDGNVNAVVRDGNTVYLGGDFTGISPSEPYGTALSTATGSPDFTYLHPNGLVNAAIPDGVGGWYIGGEFTQVGGQPRSRVARINGSGQLTAFGATQGFNDPVNALVLNNGTLFAGGSFTAHGTLVNGRGVALNNTDGAPNLSYLTPNGNVHASVPDGAGGWYIGGEFTQVGGIGRNRLARINADGTLHPWNPNANNIVHALVVSGSTVYAGGFFSNIGGQARSGIAALDATTGAATAWAPNANQRVRALAVSGNTVYAGGLFTTIGGQPRNRIAALDATTGDATAWNPDVDNRVFALAVNGNTVYAGGLFTTIGGQPRNRIAALDATTGDATAWNPDVDNRVFALAVNGNIVYAGGQFTTIGGQARNRIAALDATTGDATAWNPNADNTVRALAVSGSTVYTGGGFTTIGGQARNRIAALDATTGDATAWNPNANSEVYALAVSGSTVYAGGFFNTIGGQARNYIAALDATTGDATAWNPNADNVVQSLALSGSTVYAGGQFTTVGGQPRNRIAALDATTGDATTWNPNADGTVRALAVSGSTVYAGGQFTTIGGQARNRVAALDATTGDASAWNPNANNQVFALAVSGSTVYAGGVFSNIGGQSRNNIAALDATTGDASAWNPNANNTVLALAVSGSTVYAGGQFTTIGGQARSFIAALDATTGDATAWNPYANSTVRALAVSGSTVYAGGSFTAIGGQPRNRIAALDATTGALTAWNPSASSPVFALAVSGSTVYAGGSFTSIGGQARNHIAALDATTGDATAWDPNANSDVYALALSGSTVYAGGQFTTIGGQTRNRIAALDATTGDATAWDPNANNIVRALLVSGSTVYAGGAFSGIGGQTRNHIAALDATTGDATAWNPNANSDVYALALSGSTVYAGGFFTTIGGQARNRIAALDATTGDATAWNPDANSQVYALAVSGSTVFAGGRFNSIGGLLSRRFIAALDTITGEAIPGWNPSLNDEVLALAVSGSTVYAGGRFVNIFVNLGVLQPVQIRKNFAVILYEIPCTNQWTGAISTDWNVAGNWCSGSVPGASDEAVIPTTPIGGNMPTVNIGDAAVGDITIEVGATLTISSGNALMVDGVLTNDGTVNVQNAASLVQTTGSTLAGSGTFNVTRNGSGVYDYWSAPTVGTTTSFLGGNVFQYNPATGSMDNADDNTGSGDPGWANASGTMTAARGYAAYGAGTKTFTGTVHNGDVSVAVEYYTPEPEPFSGTFVQGVPFNLIGNPYPSGIDIGSFLFENNAAVLEDGTVYLWDDPGTGPGSYATGDYAEMNAATFTSGGGATASTYPVIGSHQGFKVRVRSGVTEVNLTNDMRTAGNTASFFKQDDRKLLWLSVVSSGNHYNQTAIAFFDDATDAADWGYDAPKLNTSSALSLFSYLDGSPFGIQTYGPLQASREVPLGLHTMQPQSVTFRLDSTENMPTGDIILEDRQLGTFHDLRASDHTCAVADGLYVERFFLHLATGPLTGVDGLHRNPCMGAWMHDGILTVVTDGATSAVAPIELLDMQGRTVWRASLTGQRTVADLSGLAKGVYTVRMANANGPCAIKVVR